MALPLDSGVLLNIPHAISEDTLEFLSKLGDPALTTGLPEPDDVAGWNRLQELVERHAIPLSDRLVDRFAPAIAGFSLGGVPVLNIRPRNWTEKNKVAIYTHGGGFTLFSAASTLGQAALFADDTALRVISVDYTLAPIATFEEITNQVVTVIRTLLNQGYRLEDTLIFGDSSGGGLAMAVIFNLRNLGFGVPGAAILFSPCIDLSSLDDTDLTKFFPSVIGKPMRQPPARTISRSACNTRFTPIYANFSKGFPPTFIQGGTQEALLGDFFRLYHVLELAGVQVKLDLYEGMSHSFQFRDPDAPESKIARRKVRDFVRLHFGPSEHSQLTDKARRATLEISKIADTNSGKTH